MKATGRSGLLPSAATEVAGLPVGDPVPGFNYLFPKLLPKLESASRGSWVVYAETEYFGGAGGQGAVAIRDGSVIYGPRAAECDCINHALASVGVQVKAPAHDEFETVGLHLHRWTNGWVAGAPDGDA